MKANLRQANLHKLTFCSTLLLAILVILPLTSQYWPNRTRPTTVPAALSPLNERHTVPSRLPSATPRPILLPSADSPALKLPAPASTWAATETSESRAEPRTTAVDPITRTAAIVRPTPTPTRVHSVLTRRLLGLSSRGWPIESYQIGQGPLRLAFIGGIHGGYEWNTILLAYHAISFFASHPEQVPASISLSIVPSANPDGQVAVVGHAGRFAPSEIVSDTIPGRFNGNDVDLNRNWDCNWVPTGLWGDQEVSAGTRPFSEPETRILRDFLTRPPMDAVVFWHSAKPGVFAGGCDAPSPQSNALANVYAAAAQYPLLDEFSDYSITGDAADWLSTQGIPAIVVELTDHSDTEWLGNIAGIKAVIDHFAGARNTPVRKTATTR